MSKDQKLSRRSFLTSTAGAAAGVVWSSRLAAAPAFRAAETSLVQTSLKDAYRDAFRIGAALDFRRPDEFNAAELELIKTHFNVLTPENSMKPGPVHPQENEWNWTPPDTLVNFCEENEMATVGHTLVWHAQTNPWFFEDATRDVALERLRNHILTLVGRYRGRMMGWDVVNEAINDGGDDTTAATENLRQSRWLQIVGPDYLLQAFRFAREADPDVALHYNDYNIESGPKHRSSLLLLERLISDGAPITTVGIQGHWNVAGMTDQKLGEIDQAIQNYKALNLTVAITELDVSIRGQAGGQLGGGGRGRGDVTPPSPEQLQAQADAYAKLFGIFLKHKDVIDRVTFWGLNDRRSWRSGQNPLVFDRENQPKPAFQSIMAVAPG
jgi:GH35 family endo-1,4-beta-xylanase